MNSAEATACANIALAKYWGKADRVRNIPAVPSLSITLDGLLTTTRVSFDSTLNDDQVELDGAVQAGKARSRVVDLLDRMRKLKGNSEKARVVSSNAFPTAAGLASSASGFAALVCACDAALGLGLASAELSGLARQCSASAARSLYGGFVELIPSAETASPVASAEHFPLRLLVAVTARGPKAIGSTEAMELTRATSPYYSAWLEAAPPLFERAKRAVLEKDLNTLGAAMEQSTLLMHASMFGSSPAVIYFEPTTLAVLRRIYALRAAGVPAFFTMDAGPHVKVLVEPQYESEVRNALAEVNGVENIFACGLGECPRVVRLGAS